MIEEDKGGDEFTAEEQAYFETGGEAEVKEAPAEPEKPETEEDRQPEADPSSDQDVPRDEKGKFVPHGALHAEREEHKKTKAQLEEISRKQAILEDRWNTILKVQENQKAPEEDKGPPNPEEDIIAWAKWQAQENDRLRAEQARREQEERQTREQRDQEQSLWNEWNTSVQDFAKAQPDFTDAAKFLSDMRTKQLEALAIVNPELATEQGRVAQINAELKAIVTAAKQKGINPAQAVYQLASGYGYTKQAAPQEGDRALQLPDSLANVQKAQEGSRTLVGSGKAATDPDSPEAIAAMSTREFEAWYAKPENQRRFERMMGA